MINVNLNTKKISMLLMVMWLVIGLMVIINPFATVLGMKVNYAIMVLFILYLIWDRLKTVEVMDKILNDWKRTIRVLGAVVDERMKHDIEYHVKKRKSKRRGK